MKTRTILSIDGAELDLDPGQLKNWDEVKCSYKRNDLSGVVRSFSSKFEFVGEAYERLRELYLRDGVNSSASIALWAMDNDWKWHKEYEAPLDFSSISWDGHTISLGCVDNGFAALIKSRKGTKYELAVGEDVAVSERLSYDRLVMQNSCVHEIMGEGNDESHKDGAVLIGDTAFADMLTTSPIPHSLATNLIGDARTYENSPVLPTDQSTDGGCILEAVRAVPKLHIRVEVWNNHPYAALAGVWDSPQELTINLVRFIGNGVINIGQVYHVTSTYGEPNPGAGKRWMLDRGTYLGVHESLEALRSAYPTPPQDAWAVIGTGMGPGEAEEVYITPVSNRPELVQWELAVGSWISSGSGRNESILSTYCHKHIHEFELTDVPAGAKLALYYVNIRGSKSQPVGVDFPVLSKITTEWESRAKPISIDAIRPQSLLAGLAEKIADGNWNIRPFISDHDPRIAKTYLLAGESVRGISGAKVYTTFNEFCNWMETVYGYVYTLGEPEPPRYKSELRILGIKDDWNVTIDGVKGGVVDGRCPDAYCAGEPPMFIRSHNCFCVYDGQDSANMYTQWYDSEKYNSPDGGPRRDVIFRDNDRCYIAGDSGLVEYTGDAEADTRPTQSIRFLHRSELFRDEAQDAVFCDATDVQLKGVSSRLYSTVEIGYDKQDYEAECGRDEWNFGHVYTTGIDVTEKKLTLKSKYRADCYGLEYMSQERAKDTTDNKSDSNIFFVYCKEERTESEVDDPDSRAEGDEPLVEVYSRLVIDRSCSVRGALSESVFNGEFSPYHCVMANEGYISSMAPNMTLSFASSDGNSDIVIDGVAMKSDIRLTRRLFSVEELKFTSQNIDRSIDFDRPITVCERDMAYSGFLSQVEYCLSRPTEVEYTIIVKEIRKS